MSPGATLQLTAGLVLLEWRATLPLWIVLSLCLTVVFDRLSGSRGGLRVVGGMTAAAVVIYFSMLAMLITNNVTM